MKKILALTLAMAMIFCLVACGSSSSTASTSTATATAAPAAAAATTTETAPSGDVLTIQLAHSDTVSETGIHHKMALLFKDYVEELSNGTMTIEIVGGGQLGGERDLVEGMQLGTIEMASTANMVLSNFMAEFSVLDLPYVISNYETAYKVLDSDVIAEVIEKFADEQGVRILAYHQGGFRHVVGNKAVTQLSDFAGMKIRVPESDIYISTFNALGGSPTPLAYTETFTALQQGTVDAFEITPAVVLSNNFYEVCSDLSITNHLYSPNPLMISESLYQSLTAEQQAVLSEAAQKAAVDQRAWIEANEENILAELEAKGMTIDRPEISELQAAVQSSGLYDNYKDKIGVDLFNAVMDLVG